MVTDVSGVVDVKVEFDVIVYGISGQNSVDEIAKRNRTINYEIVCALGERVPRVYKKNGQIKKVIDNIVRR